MIFQSRLTALFLITANLFCYSAQQGSQCDESGDAIKFEDGKSYKYEFSSVTTQYLIQEEDGVSNLLINGEAILTKKGPCEYMLSLEKLGISNRDAKGATIPAKFSATAVKFTRRNGVVYEFFTSENDDAWLVNIKRAIVSMLQNKAFGSETSTSTMEVSISGNCPTTHFKNGNTYIKEINLNHCSDRETIPYSHLGISYEVSPGHKFQSHPLLLNSSSFCEQTVVSGIIQTVTCSEKHQVFPRRIRDHSTGTLVKSSLKLTATESKYTADEITKMNEDIKQASKIIFDQGHKKKMGNGHTEVSTRIKNILTHLESDMDQAEYYIELLDALKDLENPMELYSGTDFVFTQKAKNLFIDAAAETDTTAALLFLSNLIQKDASAVHTDIRIRFYKRIGFSAEPTVEGLDSLEALVQSKVIGTTTKAIKRDMDIHLLLGASGYANQFCKLTTDSCSESPNLKKLSETISTFVLESGVVNNKNSENAIIPALHALGNLPKLSPGAVSKILIYLGDTQEDWVRNIAMQAFRNDPCQKELKDKVKSILGMATASTDVRINAYLALSKCLMAEDLPVIDAVFKDPESASLGRFIISHVRNIKASSSPSKTKLKNSLSQITIPEKLDTPRESTFISVYHEFSKFDEETNAGISAGVTVIFGNLSSSVPLAVTLDVTVDAIGKSYNVFEGALSRRTIQDVDFSNGLTWDHFMLLLESSQRNDAYLRLFGLTRYVGDFRITKLSLFSFIREAIDEVDFKGNGLEVIKVAPFTFLNLEISYPTISGFPLSLDLKGASVHSLKANNVSGGLSYYSLKSEPLATSSATVSIDFKRLDSLSFTGVLRVGRPHFTPMHTGIIKEYSLNHLFEGGIDFVKDKLVKLDLKIRLPKTDFSVFSFNKDTYFYESIDGSFNKVAFSKSSFSTEMILDQVCEKFAEKLTGVLFCGSIHYPNNGIDRHAAQYNLTLRKSEAQMEGFQVKIDVNIDDSGNKTMALVFDTPGSSTFRKVTADYKSLFYTEETPENYSHVRNLDVMTPWENINGNVAEKYSSPSKDASGADVLGMASIESSFTADGLGTYKLNYMNKYSDYGDESDLPLYWTGLSRSKYERSLQLIVPQEVVAFSVNHHLSQENVNMKPNISYSFAVGGTYMQDMGADGSLLATLVKQEDPSDKHEIIKMEVAVKTNHLGNVDFQVNHNISASNPLDQSAISSLKIGDKTYMHNTIMTGNTVADEASHTRMQNYDITSSYSESPGDKKADIKAKCSFGTLPNATEMLDFTATVSSSFHKTISAKAEARSDNHHSFALIQLNKEDENLVKVQGELISENPMKVTSSAFIKHLLEFNSNVTLTQTDMTSQFQALLISCNTWVKNTCKASKQGDLFTHHSETEYGHDEKTVGTVTTDTNANMAARTLDSKSVATMNGQTDTVTTKATWPENILNGHSGAIVTVAVHSGEIIREVFELDTVEDRAGESLSGTVHFRLEDTAARPSIDPIDVSYKVALAWKNKQPEEMSFTHNLMTDLKYSRGCPEVGDRKCHDLHVIKEIDTSCTKAKDAYVLVGSIKSEGSLMKADLKGSLELLGLMDEIFNRGQVRINGSSSYPGSRDNLITSIQYDYSMTSNMFQRIMDMEFRRKFYATVQISNTQLESGETSMVFYAERNSTRDLKSITDFEILESGRFTIGGNTTKWGQIIRMHDKQFLFIYELAAGDGDAAFIEFSVKIRDENEQMKLDVLSKNTFDHQPSNFNFTLTR